ncbi:MAG: hypothetical protein E6Q97_15615 [Desulfurellales bacterium]|nr:MAG: hypothetical protein E6Q97_15615 [Desulfurellales bacterium]
MTKPFDYAQNDRICDAMDAYAAFKVYLDKVTTYKQNNKITPLKDASFTLTIWELARKADAAIRAAGIGGMTVDAKFWAWRVKVNLDAGHYATCNVDHLKELLKETA